MSDDTTRARLLSLLSEACELEHALCCSYLFTAFSIKREIGEGLDWRQQQMARKWASQIYHIAAQEMLHLAQVWNILTAVGGSPYYQRPNFPQPARNFPLKVPLSLRRFDDATLERFIVYENPANETDDPPSEPPSTLWPLDETYSYTSVGRLYMECARLIRALDPCQLFVGDDDRQIGTSLIDFYDIVEVNDRDTALHAIARIMEQGEGLSEGRENSHYGMFVAIRKELRSASGPGFEPARPVGDNPFARARSDQLLQLSDPRFAEAGIVMTHITDEAAVLAADLFDDVYVAMLQALAHVFSNASRDDALLRLISRSALELMITVIKPLGEAICLMPSGMKGVNAGPTFAISRHAQLPYSPKIAVRVYGERLQGLARHGGLLAGLGAADPLAAANLKSAAHNLERIAQGVMSGRQFF
jgi:hypothetical protein